MLRISRVAGFSVLALTIASSPTSAFVTAGTVCPAPVPVNDLVATFSSDFSKTRILDISKWSAYSGFHNGGEQVESQIYEPSQVSIVPGLGLQLATVPNKVVSSGYISGEVTTKNLFSQTYGHFEILARMPEANGMWPAFWMKAADGTWPPEIDVVEYIYALNGVLPSIHGEPYGGSSGSVPATTLHWGTMKGHMQLKPRMTTNIDQFHTFGDWNLQPPPKGWGLTFTGFHTYSIDWRPSSLVWFIDGSPVFCVVDTASTGNRVPSSPMYMLINDAVSSGTRAKPQWPGFIDDKTAWPQTMDIAYVRVSQFKDLVPPIKHDRSVAQPMI